MLSIIIPTLNEAHYLPSLLESIKRQNTNCEIIVADAASTDRTEEIAQKYGCSIVLGGNQAQGRNAGAKAAHGDILLFIDADTVLPENYLRDSLSELQQRGLDLATNSALPLSRHPLDLIAYSIANLAVILLQKFHPLAQGFCIFARKNLHDQIGGFDPSITFGEDSEYVARAARAGRFGVLKKKILVSSRRFEKEGHIRLMFKYFRLNFRRLVRGEIREPIDYRYGDFSD